MVCLHPDRRPGCSAGECGTAFPDRLRKSGAAKGRCPKYGQQDRGQRARRRKSPGLGGQTQKLPVRVKTPRKSNSFLAGKRHSLIPVQHSFVQGTVFVPVDDLEDHIAYISVVTMVTGSLSMPRTTLSGRMFSRRIISFFHYPFSRTECSAAFCRFVRRRSQSLHCAFHRIGQMARQGQGLKCQFQRPLNAGVAQTR